HPPKKGYDFDTVNKQTCQTYSFGKTSSCHLSIDASLTKLFECMTLAYRVFGKTDFGWGNRVFEELGLGVNVPRGPRGQVTVRMDASFMQLACTSFPRCDAEKPCSETSCFGPTLPGTYWVAENYTWNRKGKLRGLAANVSNLPLVNLVYLQLCKDRYTLCGALTASGVLRDHWWGFYGSVYPTTHTGDRVVAEGLSRDKRTLHGVSKSGVEIQKIALKPKWFDLSLNLPTPFVLSLQVADAGETTEFPLFILPFSGKLVSPKWKNFKGLKLQWRDKIRLNNAIWRAWYMQCKSLSRAVCGQIRVNWTLIAISTGGPAKRLQEAEVVLSVVKAEEEGRVYSREVAFGESGNSSRFQQVWDDAGPGRVLCPAGLGTDLEKRKNPVCHFVTPLDGSVEVDEHRRPEVLGMWWALTREEAITTEGKYWKSRIEIVIREYHKWRTYFKKRLQQHKDEDLSSLAQDDDLLYWHKHGDGWKTPVPMEEDALLSTDMLMSEFSDTLFSTLSSHPPVAWPNPREIGNLPLDSRLDTLPSPPGPQGGLCLGAIPELLSLGGRCPWTDEKSQPVACVSPWKNLECEQGQEDPFQALNVSLQHAHLGNADMIQPGLIPLQPNLDFMDTFEPFQDLFSSSRSIFGSMLPAPASGPTPDHNSPPAHATQESILPTTTLPTASLPDGFIAPPAATALDPTRGQGCEHTSQPGDPFLQPADLGPSAPPLSVPQPFLPKFAEVSKSPPVITHTASATLTHDASATTFSQSQGLIITTHYPTPSVSPCGLALSPVTRPPTVGPPQPRLTFVHPKPVSLPGGRHKQPPKIVPAPKPEPMSLLVSTQFEKNMVLVISFPGPLKREGMLASTVSQSNMVITPAAIARFHGGILVTDLGHGTGSQPASLSRLFSPSTVPDSLVKGEQVPPHGGIAQVPATGASESAVWLERLGPRRDCPNSGQASPCASEQSPSPQSPQNNCSGKSSADPKNVAALKFDHMRDMFDEYVKSRTLQNWKFWIELHRTALCWLDERCSLPVLRPTVLNTLRHLSTTTSILTDPAQLPEQAAEAVTRMGQRSGES
ncbi:hypothetical protein E2I00_018274, partial [Balaenoptera physalus]